MLKKIFFILCVSNLSVSNSYTFDDHSKPELPIVTTLDQFRDVQEINQIALKASQAVGMHNFYSVLSLHKTGLANASQYPIGTFVDTGAQFTDTYIDTFTSTSPLTQGYLFLDNNHRLSCELLSPFGTSKLVVIDTSLGKSEVRAIKKDFFNKLMDYGLELKFKYNSDVLDFLGKAPHEELDLDGSPVKFIDYKGSNKYLTSRTDKTHPMSFYEIRAIKGRELPKDVFRELPLMFRTYRESSLEERQKQLDIHTQHMRVNEELEKQYSHFFKASSAPLNGGAGGDSGEV